MTDLDLDALLAAARDTGPAPSQALIDRVMTDAAALQPRPAPVVRPVARGGVGWLGRLASVFGGGGALAGVSLAMVAGVFIGVMQPEPVAALTSALLVDTSLGTVDLLPAGADLWEEQTDE